MRLAHPLLRIRVLTTVTLLVAFTTAAGGAGPRNEGYARFVWPPPPDEARIRLTAILSGRGDIEATSRLARLLIGASPEGGYDRLRKPFGVKFDAAGRILVTDSALGAVFRFDRAGRRMDVFGTKGSSRLQTPLGLDIGPDGTTYVADAGRKRIFAFAEDGTLRRAYGRDGNLTNPTGVAVSPDGKHLYVADSRAHRIVIFEVESGEEAGAFGSRGAGVGELSFPTSLLFSREGELCVVDQMNSRVVIYSAAGEPLDTFGEEGTAFGRFVRPKDIAIDEAGLIYVTDAAFGNVQIFARDLRLLTFVGRNGTAPGEFRLAAGVATRGDEFVVVDQLNGRVQVFRFIEPASRK